eukprot:4541107-Pleurochrysis_carterae.AAC.6
MVRELESNVERKRTCSRLFVEDPEAHLLDGGEDAGTDEAINSASHAASDSVGTQDVNKEEASPSERRADELAATIETGAARDEEANDCGNNAADDHDHTLGRRYTLYVGWSDAPLRGEW